MPNPTTNLDIGRVTRNVARGEAGLSNCGANGRAFQGCVRFKKLEDLALEWVLIPVLVLLFIPEMQVALVRFINPPWTLPMLIEQAGATFSKGPKSPLRYRWINLPQMPEMFLKHL